jgi:hypothetical protein
MKWNGASSTAGWPTPPRKAAVLISFAFLEALSLTENDAQSRGIERNLRRQIQPCQ